MFKIEKYMTKEELKQQSSKLENLMTDWQKKYDAFKIVIDGVHIKKDLTEYNNPDLLECWENSNPKILILLNDTNGWNNGGDMTSVNLDYPRKGNFQSWIGRYLFATREYFLNKTKLALKDVNKAVGTLKKREKFMSEFPYVHLNVKKEPGESSVSEKDVNSFFDKDKELIKREIEIYCPELIINCSKVKQEKIENLCEELKIKYISVEHPSSRTSKKIKYENFIKKLEKIEI